MKFKMAAKRIYPEDWRVDLTDWNLAVMEDWEKLTEKLSNGVKNQVLLAATEAVELALTDGVFVSFDTDECPDDVVISIHIPLGNSDGEPDFAVSLSEMIEELHSYDRSYDRQKLAMAFRSLADKISKIPS